MESFICKIRTPQGQITKVKMQEENRLECLKKLKRNGMTPISVEKTLNYPKLDNSNKKKITANVYSNKNYKFDIKTFLNIKESSKVSNEELKLFTQEFYCLKQSNFSNSQALSVIIKNTENKYLKNALIDILENMKSNKYMYKTMKNYNDIFPFIYMNFIKSGELTDNLEKSFLHAINYLDEEEKISKKIKNEIFPNLIIFLLIICVSIFSLIYIIPSIQNIVNSSGENIALPKLTVLCMNIFKLLKKYFYIVILIGVLIFWGVKKYINTPKGKMKYDYFKYKNKLFGKLNYLIDFSNLLKSISFNYNKIRIQDLLEISKNFVDNSYMKLKIEESINNIYLGKDWLNPFENEKKVNSTIIEMIRKSQNRDSKNIIEKVIIYLNKEIENELNNSLKRILEYSYIIIGISIILFLIIILIPCIQAFLGGLLII